MAYIPPTSHITLLATLRRERLLPVPGEVLVAAGQHVETGDIVARAELADHHRLIDVARALGVPREKAADFLTKAEGEQVKKGEPIAIRKTWLGLSTRREVSPVDGRLVFCDHGQALLAAITSLEVRAGLPGTVVSVVSGRGVLIETAGALLEGVWGNGREDFSVLRALGDGPAAPLRAEQLEPSMQGAILAAGWLADAAALQALAGLGVRGLILGTAPTELLPSLQAAGFPVLVVDGFGQAGFSAPAFALVGGNSGREMWLSARPLDRQAGTRPEAIVPLPTSHEPPAPPLEGEPLQEGKRVRVVRGAEAGRVGTVIGLSDRPMPLPNGVRAHVAAVALDETQGARPTVTVPFANLELLE
ncbi:MAG: hypothetical protein JNK29_02635 [Anaerolineales bacterium]|nr:hypothetical protein [Anaerolineales bacterium]